MARIPLLLLAYAIAMFLSWQAHSQTRPLADTWQVSSQDCTDLYDTPVPPSGDPGLESASGWNNGITAPVDLQANLGAAPQTSGDPDGLCDAAPWTFNTAVAISGGAGLVIGPLNLRNEGVMVMANVDDDLTAFVLETIIALPWDPTATHIVGQSVLAVGDRLAEIGNHCNSSSQVSACTEAGLAQFQGTPFYLNFTLSGTGTPLIDLALYPWVSDKKTRRSPR